MVHYPDLVLCDLRWILQRALRKIDTRGLKVEPYAQCVSPITFDYSRLSSAPRPAQRARKVAGDLVWMSYKGYAPAMLDLVKLSARDDVIRLTPRFAYYLLRFAESAGQSDPAFARLLAHARLHLSAQDRAEIEERVASRQWPRSERMVVD